MPETDAYQPVLATNMPPEMLAGDQLFWYRRGARGPHAHDDRYEIAYFPDGHESYQVDGQPRHLPPRSLVVSPPGCVHGEHDRSPASMWWLQLPRDLSQAVPAARVAYLRDRLAAAAANAPLRVGPTIGDTMQTLFRAARSDDPTAMLRVRSALLQLLADIAIAVTDGGAPGPPPEVRMLRPALRYMREHLTNLPAMSDLAAMCDMSERSFRDRFRQAFHVSPSDYILRLRIRRAMRLLEESDATMDQIAEACGFANGRYFSTTFRRLTHFNPSGWRITVDRLRHE